jgi:hypothetical protein
MEDIRLTSDYHGMARVAAALITRDAIDIGRKDIDDLAFSFIPPLSPDNNCVHYAFLFSSL